MTDRLIQHIESLLPGTSINKEDLLNLTVTRSVKKGEILIAENKPCDAIYFVGKGCLYLYYEHNNMQQVIHFALENWWLTDYKTFADAAPAVYNVAALEDSELVVMTRRQYETLQNLHPVIAIYFNKIHERAYGAALLKQKVYATLSKQEFYRYFRDTYPATMARIPDAVFASYMDISLEALKQLKEAYIS